MMSDARYLVRMNSGNDSLENIKVCQQAGVEYLIKRNLRKESKEEWLRLALERGEQEESRPGKEVWHGERYVERTGITGPLRIVYRVTKRTVEANGQALLIPKVEVESYWTSLDVDVERVIELYHEHGTSEQFHSELKSDLDLERLPSRKFQTNELVLLLGMVAYNILRLIGQESLNGDDLPMRKKVSRRRVRSVMQDMIYLASRVVRHARRLTLSFGRYSPWYDTWRRVYWRLVAT